MTVFPTIYPTSITFDHGQPQVTEYQSFGIGPVRFRNANTVNDQNLTFQFTGISQASVDLIRDHYVQNQGTAGEFSVPVAIFGGLNVADASSNFRYLDTPREEHFGVYFNVTVTFQALRGVDMFFILDGGPATLPAEQAFSKFVFDGNSPFILNGSTSALATLILNAN